MGVSVFLVSRLGFRNLHDSGKANLSNSAKCPYQSGTYANSNKSGAIICFLFSCVFLYSYLFSVFISESDPRKADSIFHLENECVCFHTGLYTPQYKGIYGYFERNNFSDSLRDWYFRGFCDELSPKLRYIEPLPQKPVYHMAQSGINFNPEWPIRVNVNHILGDEENLERIPAKIRKVKNLPLLFETAVELGRRKSVIEPGLVVPQGYQGRVQYLLPVYLTNMQKPDLAISNVRQVLPK